MKHFHLILLILLLFLSTNILSFISLPQYDVPPPEDKEIILNLEYPDTFFFIYNFFKQTEYKNVALEITAMSILESDNYRSKMQIERKNFWSLKKRPNGKDCINGEKNCLIKFNNITESCQYMLGTLRKRWYHKSPEEFILDTKRKNFATDPKYIQKITSVRNRIKKFIKD